MSKSKGMAASADAETGSRASTEPCCTVSALTGFDPARKNSDAFQVHLDAARRMNALEKAADSAFAIYWLQQYGRQSLAGSNYGSGFTGHGEAAPYLKAAQEDHARQLCEYAIKLALADVEAGYASAIEARSDETQSGSAEGESAAPKEDAR